METPVSFICEIFSLVAGTVYLTLDVSCLIGYLIVRNCLTVVSVIFQAASHLLRLCQVIIEDYCVFLSDLYNTLCFVGYCVQLFFESVYSAFYYLVQLGFSLYSLYIRVGDYALSVKSSACNVLFYLLQLILDVLILIRNTALLVGLGVWDIVTGVPEYVYSLIYECLQKGVGGVSVVNVYIHQHLLRPVYDFLYLYNLVKSSVLLFPFKPVCGLSIAILLFCIVLKKRRSLLNFACCTWLSMTTRSQQAVVCAWQTFEGYVLWLLTNQRRDWQRVPLDERFNDAMFDETETDSGSEAAADNDIADHVPQLTPRKRGNKDHTNKGISEEIDASLCVVCQDKARSMLTLPCRHVCLCNTCCTAVRARQGLCPLCRQEINFAGRVYL